MLFFCYFLIYKDGGGGSIGLGWYLNREKKKSKRFYGLDCISLRVFVDRGKDGDRKQVPLFKSHRDKRFAESVDAILNQFDSEGVISFRKLRVSHK